MKEVDVNLEDAPMVQVPLKREKESKSKVSMSSKEDNTNEELVSCLRNERVIVRYISRQTNLVKDPKHVLYGGMAENAKRTFVVPKLQNGAYKDPLTKSEKAFLEDALGLEYNALSIYKRPEIENFWCDANSNGINKVVLSKQDNYLDLSDPADYIRYKILLINKDYIAPSLSALQDFPKATYQFYILNEGDESKNQQANMSTTMLCYKEFGKIENNIDILRTVVELIDKRPTAQNVRIETLQNKCNEFIQADNKTFLKVITDPTLKTKSIIRMAKEAGIISTKGNYLYLRSDNSPLCEQDEEPTLSYAAKFLNSPKHQDILLEIQAKLNK